MKDQIIISLGSNRGDRLESLYKALAHLDSHPIKINSLSKVYETPSWGFESEPFYNACVTLETKLNPKSLLDVLLDVEEKMGRYRTKKNGYESRIIDLDLLFYGSKIIFSSELKVPHPRLHQRNFVLAPLCEIAPKFVHPILHQTSEELFQKSSDNTTATPLIYDLSLPPIFKKFPYIVIEGNIGVGKTTLATKIAKYYRATLLTESFSNNPFLEDFYKNPKSFALQAEKFFLNDRFENDISFWRKKHDFVIADFSIYKSLVFSNINLDTLEYNTYKKDFENRIKSIKKPDLLIFLKCGISKLKANIQSRERSFEKNINRNYLINLQKGYKELLKKNISFNIKEIDVNKKDFESDENTFKSILRAIFRASF